jgi:hypothetical protein
MNSLYIRFWIEFELENNRTYPPGIGIGCGVSAIDYQDAVEILKRKMFKETEMPKIKRHVPNVDIRELDQGHVIPNMNPPNYRGIWFPLGND